MGRKGFQDLIVWQKAKDLAVKIYKISKSGVLSRDFGLRDQIRRSAINYPAASSGVLSILRHAGLDPASSRFLLWIPAFAGMTDARQAAGYWTRSE